MGLPQHWLTSNGGEPAQDPLPLATAVNRLVLGGHRESQVISGRLRVAVQDVLLEQREEALYRGVIIGGADPAYGADQVMLAQGAAELSGSKVTGFKGWLQHRLALALEPAGARKQA